MFGDARLCEAALIQVVLVLSIVFVCSGLFFYGIQLFDVDDDDDDYCALGSVYRPASK